MSGVSTMMARGAVATGAPGTVAGGTDGPSGDDVEGGRVSVPEEGRSTDSGDGLARRRLFGLEFVDASLDEVVDVLADPPTAARRRGGLPVVVTPNVDQLVHLERDTDPVASALISRAAWVLPDGQPIVWAGSLLRSPLASRLAGSDLVDALFPQLVARGAATVVIASSEEVAERIRSEGPRSAAIVAPQLDLADRAGFDAFVDLCAAVIDEVGPSHVFVTLGFPKRCNLIAALLARHAGADHGPPLYLAIGAAFDMHYGLVRRAPRWMQRGGLEWLFRFVLEPRRLFRRYFVDDPAFFAMVWRERRRPTPLRSASHDDHSGW